LAAGQHHYDLEREKRGSLEIQAGKVGIPLGSVVKGRRIDHLFLGSSLAV